MLTPWLLCVEHVRSGPQRKRLNSQRWPSTEEHVEEGDLGLGTVAQLDICTGTAVCTRAASGGNLDIQEGDNETKTDPSCSSLRVEIQQPECISVMTDSSDDDHLTMEDLICYSFQVAKGMEFLSSRKVCHDFSLECGLGDSLGANFPLCSSVYPQRPGGQKHPAL